MFRHSTARFFSVLIVAIILSPLWRGLLPGRATPVWGQARFRTTPRVATTPHRLRRFFQHHGQLTTPPPESRRSLNSTGDLQYRHRGPGAL
jgi:hypothetical protein